MIPNNKLINHRKKSKGSLTSWVCKILSKTVTSRPSFGWALTVKLISPKIKINQNWFSINYRKKSQKWWLHYWRFLIVNYKTTCWLPVISNLMLSSEANSTQSKLYIRSKFPDYPNLLGSGLTIHKPCQLICLSGVNFINILRAAFMLTDPKSAKRQSSQAAFLRFWDLQA